MTFNCHLFYCDCPISLGYRDCRFNGRGPSWPWSYCSCIYNYLCNQCLSPLMLWVRISIMVRRTTLCDKVCQWLATGRWFSPGPPLSSIGGSTNKTDRHDITEILLRVALNTIKQTNKQTNKQKHFNGSKPWISTPLRFCINVAKTLQINTKKMVPWNLIYTFCTQSA
jgi:hypothetical protein